jgi:amino acid permease
LSSHSFFSPFLEPRCTTVVKGIVGAGVLSLPAGIAAFGSAPSAALPAVILIAVIGSLSAYGFGLTGRVCALTKTATYRSAWSASMSEKSSWIPAWTVTFKTFCAILAYSMILADTFQSLLGAATGITYAKTLILPTVTVAVLLPLCLLRNLSSLAPFSLLGSLGMLYTAIAMFWRYATKAYTLTGKFGTDMPVALRPAFGNIGAAGIMNAKASILIGMLSTAYMARKSQRDAARGRQGSRMAIANKGNLTLGLLLLLLLFCYRRL